VAAVRAYSLKIAARTVKILSRGRYERQIQTASYYNAVLLLSKLYLLECRKCVG